MKIISKKFILLFVGVFLLMTQTSSVYAGEKNGNFHLTILHVNDVHARVEQYPLLKTAVDEIREETSNTLFLHAGDEFTGTLYFSMFHGFADLYFLNQLAVDAFVLGNHEFDKGPKELATFIKKANFPFVSANIDVKKNKYLGQLYSNEITMKFKKGKIYQAIIKEVDGERIGIFGLTTEETPYISNPGPELTFQNAVEKGKEIVHMLKEKGVNKIILLSHLGLKEDKALAKKIDGIDVIVGGHSHTETKRPVFIEKNEPVIIVQGEEYLESLGKLDVTFNKEGVISDYKGKLVKLHESDFSRDATFENRLNRYKSVIEKDMTEIVGQSKTRLNGKSSDVRKIETNLGNVIADSVLWKAKQKDRDVSIALINGGSIRGSIGKGNITVGDIRTVLPFENKMVIVELTGDEIRHTLETSVENYPELNPGFLQVAGLRFEFDKDKKPGFKIQSIDMKSDDGKYSPIDAKQTYKVVTFEYLVDGGDKHEVLKHAKEARGIKKLSVKDYQAFREYLKENETIRPKTEGRIQIH